MALFCSEIIKNFLKPLTPQYGNIDTTLNLPHIKGGKKLIYTHIDLPLTALEDLEAFGRTDPRFARLAELVGSHQGLWCAEAEQYLLENF